LWRPDRARTSRDDIVVFEVMVRGLDAAWWREYRAELEARFRQDVVVVRALAMRLL
jgi:flavin-binding protein dodecin